MKKKELRELVTKYENALMTIAGGSKHSKEIAQKALGITYYDHQPELLWEENHELKLQVEQLQKAILKNLFDTEKNKKTVDELIEEELDESLDNLLKKEELEELKRCFPNNPTPWKLPSPDNIPPSYGHPTAKDPDPGFYTTNWHEKDYLG